MNELPMAKNRNDSSLKREVEEIKDELIKQNRNMLDLMYNLDLDNMSSGMRRLFASFTDGIASAQASISAYADSQGAMWEALAAWKAGTTESIAQIKGQADANGSAISSLAQWKNEAVSSISAISQKADANESSISAIAQWQSETESSIAAVDQKADANGSAISSLAQWKNEAVSSISAISQKASANESSITAINSWRSGAAGAISTLQSWVNSYGAELEGLAEYSYGGSSGIAGLRAYARSQADGAEENAIDAVTSMFAEVADEDGNITQASITAAVEEAMSSIYINADRILLNGDTFFTAYYSDYEFGSIKTYDDGSGTENNSRYALIIESNGGTGWNSNYAVALKLKSEGNMMLDSYGALYVDAAKYITLYGRDNTRIRANTTYGNLDAAPAVESYSGSRCDYVFCTDGIYYNGNRIISSDGKVRLVFS